MTVWMDMTNSLVVWQGGVVGIVRAELELAKNLYKIDPHIEFACLDGQGYRKIDKNEISWLLTADNVCDAYMEHFGRQIPDHNKKNISSNQNTALDTAIHFSQSRTVRLREGLSIFLDTNPFKGAATLKSLLFVILDVYLKLRSVFWKNNRNIGNVQQISKEKIIPHFPFKNGDKIFSCGWYGSNKENILNKIKGEIDLDIVYVVYDTIMLNTDLTHLYANGREGFKAYLSWISRNCTKVLTGGKSSMDDLRKYYQETCQIVPEIDWIKFGGNVGGRIKQIDENIIKSKYDIKGDYVMAVGSIEPRKNYKLLYRAFSYMLSHYDEQKVPSLIIVGKEYDDRDLVNLFTKNIKLKSKVKIIQPSDEDLVALYSACKFTLLPTLYEGWSLTLPESLDYGKVCICSDVKPLKEIAEGLAVYLPKDDPVLWAQEIFHLFNDEDRLAQLEKKILTQWKSFSWLDSAQMVWDSLNTLKPQSKHFPLYYDLSLTAKSIYYNLPVSGVLRTQLLWARYLYRITTNIKYFVYWDRYYEVDCSDMSNILFANDVDKSFKKDFQYLFSQIFALETKKQRWKRQNSADLKRAFWLIMSVLPEFFRLKIQNYFFNTQKRKKIINHDFSNACFAPSALLLCTDSTYNSEFFNFIQQLKKARSDIKFSQLIYDFSPIIHPELHKPENVEYFNDFINKSLIITDLYLFGGSTCMGDANKCLDYSGAGVKNKSRTVVKFGSPEVSETGLVTFQKVLDKYGLSSSQFILTVGTVEARKNQEILYMAYLHLLESYHKEQLPKLVICGFNGWNTEDFIRRFNLDERVKGLITICTPSDEELQILYRKCLFTVLPTIYEGWSLTLSESLNYGKFCIASDIEPLKEIAGTLAVYVDPNDPVKWAETIMYFYHHRDILNLKENRIISQWKQYSWFDSTSDLYVELKKFIG